MLRLNDRQITFVSILVVVSGFIGNWIARRDGAHSAPVSSPVPPAVAAPVRATGNSPDALLGVDYATAEKSSLSSDLKVPGTISTPPNRTATVSPRVQGQVLSVLVSVGDRVTAGQIIARVRSLDIASATAAYHQAETQVRYTALALQHQRELAHLGSFAQKPIEDARTAVTTADAALRGDQSAVQQDLSAVQQDQSAVLQDQSQQHQDEADETHDKAQLDRAARLLQEGIMARQDFESADTTHRKDLEKLEGDRLKIDSDRFKVQQDQAKVSGDQAHVKTDQAQLRINQEALKREMGAYRMNVYTAQAIEQADSAYRAALLQLQQAGDALKIQGVRPEDATGVFDVTAPISGVITARNVNPGMTVDQSQMTPWQMFTISNVDIVDADGSVFDRDLPRIRVGLPIEVHGTAFSSVYMGRISYIAPSVDPNTHAVKVRCEIPNPRHELRDGMYVEMTIHPEAATDVVMVPTSAVQRENGAAFVYSPSPVGKLERHPVQVGRELKDSVEILSGLKEGDRVVSNGAILIHNSEDNAE